MEKRFIFAVCVLSLALVSLVGAEFARPLKKFFPSRSDERLATKTQSRDFCSENYSPCACDEYGFGHVVSCVNVEIETIQQIFFNSATPTIYSLELLFTAAAEVQDEVTIPADLLSDKRVEYLNLRGSNDRNSTKIKLTVDADAFRLTRDYTTGIQFDDLDLATDFIFLNGFSVLEELVVHNSDNVNFATLPQLPKLLYLLVWDSNGIRENAATFPSLTPARAVEIHFRNCGLDDTAIATILRKIAASTSAGSLGFLDLESNFLTSVPAEVHGLTQLRGLVLSNNAIKETRAGDLGFVSPSVYYIYLENNGLKTIEANTFEYGNFTSTRVFLGGNLLEVFAKDVFYEILIQMNSQPSFSPSVVDVQGNPFKCNCDLAWLIRDNRNLLPRVKNGKCDDFFHFEDLNESSFADCPPS